MRIIGEIKHDRLKISVFVSGGKTIIQFEDGLLEQLYKFRDGSVVTNLEEAQKFVNEEFLNVVINRFEDMARDISGRSQKILDDEYDFPKII
jgi:hypothetical protein